jgi:ribosomal protein S18 acetylase RimI-like enzyme
VASLQVRDAGPDDVDDIVALVESAYRGNVSRAGWTTEADLLDGRRTDAEAVSDIVGGPGVVLLAEADGTLVGCCRLEPVSGAEGESRTCYFGLFAVAPQRQGAGIGDRLLAAAEEAARHRFGAARLEMTVIAQRDALIAWYERRGYARTGETRPFPYGDERFGIPRRDDLHFVVLIKPLIRRPGARATRPS